MFRKAKEDLERFGWMIGRIGADKADIRLDSSIRSALEWLSRQPLLAVAS